MNDSRFKEITEHYSQLSVAVIGDYCLDRYLEIDPSRTEVSIETGLEVFNITNVRSQPGGCGTVLNNLIALGCCNLFPVGFVGQDGEGYELLRSLNTNESVNLKYFLQTSERRTFTYCKPLVMDDIRAPRELNRFDSKNWTNTPEVVQNQLAESIIKLSTQVDVMVLLGQVDQVETGVLCSRVLEALHQVREEHPELLIIADSRCGFAHFPNVCLKMNRAEFLSMINASEDMQIPELMREISNLSNQKGQGVFVSLSEDGIAGAFPDVAAQHVAGLSCSGDEIDVVGAGDAVMANLALALASNASNVEAMRIAMAVASIVVRQLGTTGVATINGIATLLKDPD